MCELIRTNSELAAGRLVLIPHGIAVGSLEGRNLTVQIPRRVSAAHRMIKPDAWTAALFARAHMKEQRSHDFGIPIEISSFTDMLQVTALA